MSDAAGHSTAPPINVDVSSLFMWRGQGIVLLGQHSQGRWVLARGWVSADVMEHVRRWSFAAPGPFAGQVRRLVAEATGDLVMARDERARALAWVSTVSPEA